ncbi:hypothetical protein LP417_03520 [Polaromonas sp. P1-6]|nr:hypothetical protein LP417_03520 [Polaromonas sp. P1-6]
MSEPLHPMVMEHLYCTDAEATQQTISESDLTYSIDLGRGFTVHHGTRDGLPIVVVECQDQKADELSCVWFNESTSGDQS